ERNVIAANTGDGISITGGADSNLVAGNYIGTDAGGGEATSGGGQTFGNTNSGIFINSASNTIGGSAAGAGNVISNNGVSSGYEGIWLNGAAVTGNLIQGNLIGTD